MQPDFALQARGGQVALSSPLVLQGWLAQGIAPQLAASGDTSSKPSHHTGAPWSSKSACFICPTDGLRDGKPCGKVSPSLLPCLPWPPPSPGCRADH